jgi:hypothetical protein
MKQERISAAEFRRRYQQPKQGKYNNKTCWYDGLYFQSQKELDDYIDHKNLLRSGLISGFLWQGKLVVTEGSDKENKAVTYTPDIVVLNNDGTYDIREDKGHRTQVYINKRKIIKSRYPNLRFREV